MIAKANPDLVIVLEDSISMMNSGKVTMIDDSVKPGMRRFFPATDKKEPGASTQPL